MPIYMYLIHFKFTLTPVQFYTIGKNNMADTRICEAVATQASLTLGNTNNFYGSWNKVLSVLRCVCKIKCQGKVLSPVGGTIWVTVGVPVNESTAQMADTVDWVRIWYCMTDVTYATYSSSCVELPLCQHSAAPMFAQVHMEFVMVCFCHIEYLEWCTWNLTLWDFSKTCRKFQI